MIQVNNAGIGGIVIEGNVLFLKEVLDSEIALVLDGGEVCFIPLHLFRSCRMQQLYEIMYSFVWNVFGNFHED